MGLAKRVEGRSLSHVESRRAPRGSWAATNRPCEPIHLEGAREGEREGQDASSCSSAQWRSVAVGGGRWRCGPSSTEPMRHGEGGWRSVNADWSPGPSLWETRTFGQGTDA